MAFDTRYSHLVTTLSDEALRREFRCTQQCALTATRTRRDLALLRYRCVCREIAQRNAAATAAPQSTTPRPVA